MYNHLSFPEVYTVYCIFKIIIIFMQKKKNHDFLDKKKNENKKTETGKCNWRKIKR